MLQLPNGVEERTRVVCALPMVADQSSPDFERSREAYTRVLDYVESQQKYGFGVDGYTVSRPHAYFGRWRDEGSAGSWEEDNIVLLIIDYRLPVSQGGVWVKLWELRVEILDAYPQEKEIWLTAYPIFRQVLPLSKCQNENVGDSVMAPSKPL